MLKYDHDEFRNFSIRTSSMYAHVGIYVILVEVIHDEQLAHCITSPVSCRVGYAVITKRVNNDFSLKIPMYVVLLALVPSNVQLALNMSPLVTT